MQLDFDCVQLGNFLVRNSDSAKVSIFFLFSDWSLGWCSHHPKETTFVLFLSCGIWSVRAEPIKCASSTASSLLTAVYGYKLNTSVASYHDIMFKFQPFAFGLVFAQFVQSNLQYPKQSGLVCFVRRISVAGQLNSRWMPAKVGTHFTCCGGSLVLGRLQLALFRTFSFITVHKNVQVSLLCKLQMPISLVSSASKLVSIWPECHVLGFSFSS